ncbi:MAG: PEGA domain-containing protein [Sandaracinaceae bacterium]
MASVLLGTASVADAQSVLLIVTNAAAPEGAASLRAAGIEAIAEHGARLVPTPDAEPCEEDPCAAELARQAGADATLLVAVRGVDEVAVRAVPSHGEAMEVTEPVEDADFGAAVSRAVRRYLASADAPRTGFLMVRTDPNGARIRLDGSDAGTAPLRRSVAPGVHHVRATSSGGARREREVEVAAGEETAVVFDFSRPSQEPAEDARPEGGPRATEPSPFNWVIGAVLAVGGVVALISPLQTLARDGQCVDMVANVGCVERVHVGPQTASLLAVGIAALIAAVIVDATAPIQVEVDVDARGASASVRGRF